MLHGILMDGIIERLEGTNDLADATVKQRRKARHTAEYLFAALSEEEFEEKKRRQIQAVRSAFRADARWSAGLSERSRQTARIYFPTQR